MRQTGRILILIVAVVGCVGQVATGEDIGPFLYDTTCGKWLTYEEDGIETLNRYMLEHGHTLSDEDIESYQLRLNEQKMTYLMGLINAYNLVASREDLSYYSLPFRVGQYQLELDAVCKVQDDVQDMPISIVLLIINDFLKSR